MQALSDAVIHHLQAEGHRFRRCSDSVRPEFEISVSAENCIANCRLQVDDEARRLQLSISTGIKVSAPRWSQANLFLCQVSMGSRTQVCYQDYRAGEIVYVSVARFADELSQASLSKFIRDGVSRWDECFPYLVLVLYANMDGKRAYRMFYERKLGAMPEAEVTETIKKLFEGYKPPEDRGGS